MPFSSMPSVHMHLIFFINLSNIGVSIHSDSCMSFRFPLKSPTPGDGVEEMMRNASFFAILFPVNNYLHSSK